MQLQARVELTYEQFKVGQPRTLINATADVCGFLNGTNNDPLTKWIVGIVGASLPPGLLHSCPYIGLIRCYGLSPKADRNKFWPDGLYTFTLSFFNRRDDNIFKLRIELEIRGTGNGNSKF